MRVAFDAGPLLDPPTGVGRYVGEVARRLEARGVDLVRYAVSLRGKADSSIMRLRAPARAVQASWRRWAWPPVERLVGEVDVVHGTNFVLPPIKRAAGVVTVHDLSFYRDDAFAGGRRLRELVPWSVRRALAVIVPTAAIAEELAERLGVDAERIHVTAEGVSPVFFGASPLADVALARLGITRPFAVAAGTIEPRKNLPRLLQAWAAASDALGVWKLVLAGPKGWGGDLQPTPAVITLGWVSDETLPGLLAAAEFFCYPSLYEGFGLPPIEAMAAGTPALVGRYSAAEEVLGDACLLVDPSDTEDIEAGLRKLASDEALRRRLTVAGRARAATYTWEQTARATTEVYDAVAG